MKNVVALLPGQGPLAEEYLVVGAHYDHLGYGGLSSLARLRSARGEIHNGADDNASGTAAVLELARRLAQGPPPPRSILFVFFTAEESGLIGSSHFVRHPPVPLEHIVAMLNLDMVGRVRNEAIYVGGTGTAEPFADLVAQADAQSPLIVKPFGKGGMGPSDHATFGRKKIPVLFLFSGLHADYHRPSDDTARINFAGLEQVVDFSQNLVDALAQMPRPAYVSTFDKDPVFPSASDEGNRPARATQPARPRAALGIIPDYAADPMGEGGVTVGGVGENSAAEQAGLLTGDVILEISGRKIDNLYDLTDYLASAAPGEAVQIVILREGQRMNLPATLGRRGR